MSNTKNDSIASYFKKGKACIYGARVVSKSAKAKGTEEILLIHGIELLLSVFLLSEDKSIKKTRDIYNKYGHDYLKIYLRCVEVDKLGVLKPIRSLGDYLFKAKQDYYSNSIEARFPNDTKSHRLPMHFYEIIENKLIPQLEKLMSYKFDLENFSPSDEDLFPLDFWQQEPDEPEMDI